ncbi:response regulator [Vibrio sagamiensis]|uniref:Response regulator n=1 Tax=Vibrio sagamiensis NBRC 104589 TaxID=1219064 RepID=A0A511QCG9_9VIBR|nr:response regulator [Vibrio sagamiensis]PNQ67406.1 response regulator [Vibrio agarivorans]GEM74994.1 response regulator [Vibrio sagamiensis NBRC 104589]
MNEEYKLDISQITILIIDDSITSTILIKQQLITLGAVTNNITCVHSASEALAAAKSRFYSCLVIDYHLHPNFTGIELINLMNRGKIISDTTAILMISGDASQETVLTALSGRVRHMLTKPLQTKALKAKILIGLKEQANLTNVNDQINRLSRISFHDLTNIKQQYPNSLCIESLLIDTLIDKEMYSELEAFLPLCSEHASKVCADAFLLLNKGQIQQAALILSGFVTRNPLCLRAIDNLTGLYESLNELSIAFTYAYRAFELTPSNSQRMVTASRIASKLGDLSKLYELGHTYAKKVSATDSQWLSAMFSYTDIVIQHFKYLNNIKSRKEVLQNLNTMFLLVHRQLHTQQQGILAAFKQLTQCRLLLASNKPEIAHKKLLIAISHFYDNLFQMPTVMIRYALPLLDDFGEISVKKSLLILSSSKTSTYKLPAEKKESPQAFSEQCYPFSVEIKLRSLCNKQYIKGSHSEQTTTQYLQHSALPPNWKNWLQDYLSGSFSSKLPPPFTLSDDT